MQPPKIKFRKAVSYLDKHMRNRRLTNGWKDSNESVPVLSSCVFWVAIDCHVLNCRSRSISSTGQSNNQYGWNYIWNSRHGMKKWLKTQLKTFRSNGIRKPVDHQVICTEKQTDCLVEWDKLNLVVISHFNLFVFASLQAERYPICAE
jgi:hypothetical protein